MIGPEDDPEMERQPSQEEYEEYLKEQAQEDEQTAQDDYKSYYP